jgi:hypothetical protein
VGADLLIDGRGADTIYGGPRGDTVILEKDGTPDTVTCGPGKDEVWGATSDNTVAADCEKVHVKQPPSCRACHSGCSHHSERPFAATAERVPDER